MQITAPKENRELNKLYSKQGEETNETVEVIDEPKSVVISKTKATIEKLVNDSKVHTVVGNDFLWIPCPMGYPSRGLFGTLIPGYGTPLHGTRLA